MKKNSIYALMSAIALAGAVGFSSCSSAEEEVATNPNYNPTDNSVLTQFVFNVSTSNQASTRQKADATQATTAQTFRGIQDAYLLPYSLTRDGDASGNTHLYDISTDEKAKASRSYDFANLLTSGEITNENSRRVLEMSLPVGTSSLLFYGRATHNPTTYDANLHGSIDYTVDQNAQNTAFSLVSRLQKTDECNQIFDLFESVLNNITRAGLQIETAGDNGAKTTRDIRYAFWWGPSGLKTGFKTRKGGVGSEPLYENGYVGTATDAIPDAGRKITRVIFSIQVLRHGRVMVMTMPKTKMTILITMLHRNLWKKYLGELIILLQPLIPRNFAQDALRPYAILCRTFILLFIE